MSCPCKYMLADSNVPGPPFIVLKLSLPLSAGPGGFHLLSVWWALANQSPAFHCELLRAAHFFTYILYKSTVFCWLMTPPLLLLPTLKSHCIFHPHYQGTPAIMGSSLFSKTVSSFCSSFTSVWIVAVFMFMKMMSLCHSPSWPPCFHSLSFLPIIFSDATQWGFFPLNNNNYNNINNHSKVTLLLQYFLGSPLNTGCMGTLEFAVTFYLHRVPSSHMPWEPAPSWFWCLFVCFAFTFPHILGHLTCAFPPLLLNALPTRK